MAMAAAKVAAAAVALVALLALMSQGVSARIHEKWSATRSLACRPLMRVLSLPSTRRVQRSRPVQRHHRRTRVGAPLGLWLWVGRTDHPIGLQRLTG